MNKQRKSSQILRYSHGSRLIIFITICLVFGAATSIAVAWWATLREWEESEDFVFKENGWKGGMEVSPARTVIGAIPINHFGLELAVYGIPAQFNSLTKASPPEWFPNFSEPFKEHAMI